MIDSEREREAEDARQIYTLQLLFQRPQASERGTTYLPNFAAYLHTERASTSRSLIQRWRLYEENL